MANDESSDSSEDEDFIERHHRRRNFNDKIENGYYLVEDNTSEDGETL